MEARILEAEAAMAEAAAVLADPEASTDAERLAEAYRAHEEARALVESLYERWAELEAKASGETSD